MSKDAKVLESLQAENADLREKLEEAEETLRALRSGEVDAVIVGEQVYTLEGSGAESNRFRGEILSQINEAVIATDPGGRVIYINEAAEKLYHVDSGAALGLELDRVFRVRWFRDGDAAEFDSALAADCNWRGENVHVRNDGTEFYAESTVCLARHGATGDDAQETGSLLVVRDITERKNAEKTIEQNRKMLSLAMKSSRMGVWEQDIIGGTTWWSEELEAIFGLEEGGFSGTEQHYFDLIVEADRESSRQAVESALAEHRDYSFEFRFHHGSGEIRWMEGRGQALYSDEGEPVKIYGVGIDITDRKKLEERSRFLTELDLAVQQISEPDEVMAVTARMLADYLGADRCAYAEVEDENVFVITGDYTRDVPSIVGRWPVADFGRECARQMLANEPYVVLDTDNDPRISAEDLAAYRATTIRAVICVPLHKDGKFTAAMAVHQKVPRTWTDAEIELVQVTVSRCWEALERSRAARAVRESDERFRLALSSGAVTVYEQDKDLRYKWVYPQAPYRADLVGKTDEELSPGPHAVERNELKRRVIETGRSERGEVAADVKGNRHWYDLLIEPRTDDAGNIIGIGGTALDITDRKNAELLLETQKQALEMVVGGRSLTEVLEFLVSIVDEKGAGASVGAIMLIDDDGRLHNAASRGLPQAYLAAIEGIVADQSVGTCSAAAATCRTVITPDIAADPKWEKFRHLPLDLGLVAAWSEPIVTADGRILGTFGTYFRDKREPTELERRMVEILAQTASLAIERRRAEDKLRESEAKYRTLFHSIDEGFSTVEIIFDEEGKPSDYRFVESNPMFGKLTGLEDEIGKTALELLPDLESFWIETYGRVALTGQAIRFENYSAAMNRWFDVYASRVGGEGSSRVAIVFNNITERKQLQESFMESEERFRGLMEQAPLSIQLFEPDGRTTRVNQSWERLWGTMLEDLENYNILDDPQLEAKGIAPYIRRAFDGEAVELPEIAYDPDETLPNVSTNPEPIRWVSAVAYPLKGPDGQLREVALVHQDITERKRAEEKLAEQRRLLEALTESVLDGILIVSPDGRMLHYNQQFLDIWNFPPEIIELQSDEAALAWAAEQTTDPEAFLGRVDHIYSQPDIQFREEMWMKDGRIYERFGAPVQHGETRLGWVWTFRDITESKKAEMAVRESEERFRNMADHAPVMIWVTEPDGNCTYLSESWYEFTGQTPETGLGMGWLEATHPDDAAEAERIFLAANETHQPFRLEYRVRRADGEYRWAIDSAQPRISESGEFLGYIGSVIDITERKRSEDLVAESELRMRVAMTAANMYSWEIDAETRTAIIAKDAAKVLGFARSDETTDLHRQIGTVVHPDDRASVQEAFEQAFVTGELHQQMRFVAPETGQIVWAEIRGTARRDETGRPVKLYGVTQNITVRKQAEDALLESEDRMRTMADSIPQLAWMAEPDGYIFWYNRRWYEFTGTAPEDMEGWGWQSVHDPEMLPSVLTKWTRSIESGDPFEMEFPLLGADGEYRWFLTRVNPLLDSAGNLVRWFGTNTDVTDSKRAEVAIRERNEQLDLLARTGQELILGDRTDIPALQSIFERVCETINADLCFNYLAADDSETLGLAASVGLTKAQRKGFSTIRFGEYLCGRVAVTRERLVVGDMLECAEPGAEALCADGVRCYAGFPLLAHGHLFGTVAFATRDRDCFSDVELLSIQTVADQVAATLERARTLTSLRESEERFVKAFNSSPLSITITSLATRRLVEVNDTFVRVTGYTREEAVGRTTVELGLWEEPRDREAELETVVNAGGLRDSEYRFRMKDGSQIIGLLSAEFIEIGGEQCALTVIQDITERSKADEALRKSEERFVRFMQYLPGLAWIKDADGRYVYANDAAVKAFDRPKEQLYGRTDAEVFPPEVADRFRENDMLALKRRTGVQTVEKLEQQDGRVHHSIVNKFPIMDPDGKAALIGGMAIDITDRMQAEEALRESEETYRVLAETASDAIIRIDESSTIQFINTAATRVFGYRSDELVGQSLTMLMPEELREKHHTGFKRYLKTGKRRLNWESIEVPARHKDGRLFPLEISFGEYASDDKRFFIGVARDISERRGAEEALRKSEERFRNLADNMSQLAWTCDRLGDATWYNRRWLDYTGLTFEEMKDWGWKEVQHPDHLDRVLAGIEKARDSGDVWEDTFPLRSKTGEYRWFLSRAVPIRDETGEIVHWFGTNTDITTRREAEIALRESEERRHLAQQAGNVGIFDWDIVNDKTYWSETMWAFYGRARGDINPDEEFWSDHIHGTDRDRVKANIRQAISDGSHKFADEYRIVRPDGTIRWIEATARISRDGDGNATRMYGVNLDITHRKQAEEMVTRSEYQLRMVTDTVPALIAYVDSSERYRFVNQKYVEWFGKPREDIIGRSIEDIAGAKAYRAVKPRIDTVLAGEEVTFEEELPLKGAGTRFVRVSYSPDFGVDGGVIGFYALISDLTDLKRSQDMLRSSEERISLIVESLTDYAIFAMDGEGRIESWNRGAESIFGYTAQEILGLSFEVLFVPDDVARGIPIREMRAARQRGRASDDRWHVRKDGSRFFASGVTMPLYVGRSLTGYAKIASDLTEKQRRAEELQRAHDELEIRVVDRTKELAQTNTALLEEMEEREVAEKQRIDLLRRLVSSQESERRRIARDIHDTLGQRLTALRLKIASLKEVASGDEKFASRVERLQEISERLDSEVSFMAWELRPSALDDLGLAEAVGTFVNEWSKHYEIPADFHSRRLPHEKGNRETETHLYRITQEALNNIAKHAGAKSVSVLLERRDDNLILIIEDDGKGFDQSKLPPPIESGKGLGLLGMGERASLVGGNVEIESAPGKGTTIYARVPFFTE